MLPWEYESWGHTEVASAFTTFLGCPECGSENSFHGSLIEEEEE